MLAQVQEFLEAAMSAIVPTTGFRGYGASMPLTSGYGGFGATMAAPMTSYAAPTTGFTTGFGGFGSYGGLGSVRSMPMPSYGASFGAPTLGSFVAPGAVAAPAYHAPIATPIASSVA